MDTIENLIREASIYLEDMGYSEGTKIRYKSCWNCFKKYAILNNTYDFTIDFGYSFLMNHYKIDFDSNLTPYQRFAVRSIKVLNSISKGEPVNKCYHRKGLQVPPCYFEILKDYIEFLKKSDLSDKTIEGKKFNIMQFLHFLETNGITKISNVQSKIILIYIDSLRNYANSTKVTILYTLKSFFNFLTTNNYNTHQLSHFFLIIRSNKLEKLPSYYTNHEIQTILSHVDRNTAIGRRDYLILILAIQLGMRAGDIRDLKLNDIKWHLEKIEIIQGKTKNSLQLPLSEGLKYALIDYLKNGRPVSDDPHIFIRHRTPYGRFEKGNVFWSVINKYLVLAKIDVKDRKRGLHAMRHSLASNLLQENIPLPVISGILGHENSNTTMEYLRIDINQLRMAGLEVPL